MKPTGSLMSFQIADDVLDICDLCKRDEDG